VVSTRPAPNDGASARGDDGRPAAAGDSSTRVPSVRSLSRQRKQTRTLHGDHDSPLHGGASLSRAQHGSVAARAFTPRRRVRAARALPAASGHAGSETAAIQRRAPGRHEAQAQRAVAARECAARTGAADRGEMACARAQRNATARRSGPGRGDGRRGDGHAIGANARPPRSSASVWKRMLVKADADWRSARSGEHVRSLVTDADTSGAAEQRSARCRTARGATSMIASARPRARRGEHQRSEAPRWSAHSSTTPLTLARREQEESQAEVERRTKERRGRANWTPRARPRETRERESLARAEFFRADERSRAPGKGERAGAARSRSRGTGARRVRAVARTGRSSERAGARSAFHFIGSGSGLRVLVEKFLGNSCTQCSCGMRPRRKRFAAGTPTRIPAPCSSADRRDNEESRARRARCTLESREERALRHGLGAQPARPRYAVDGGRGVVDRVARCGSPDRPPVPDRCAARELAELRAQLQALDVGGRSASGPRHDARGAHRE